MAKMRGESASADGKSGDEAEADAESGDKPEATPGEQVKDRSEGPARNSRR